MLKALGTKRLTPSDNGPPSELAFKFNLRHYTTALNVASSSQDGGLGVKHVKWETFTTADCDNLKVGRCRLPISLPVLTPPMVSMLEAIM